MNADALKALRSGQMEKAVELLGGKSGPKKRVARNTILVMAHLDDDEWDAIDAWVDKKLARQRPER